MRSSTASLVLLCLSGSQALRPQTNVWNSTFKLSAEQISRANLTNTTASNVEIALNFERTNNAGGPTQDDPFYELPAGYSRANLPPPGTILRVEENTNISLYTIPATLSLSRILYTTETLNGSTIPGSAFVLWPYLPRSFPNLRSCSNLTQDEPVFPVVAWPHGSTGQGQACAPSGIRNLWDEFHLLFPLALAGYTVVAPDFAGQGVANVTDAYFIFPAEANDLFYALEAAQKAWPRQLSKKFVVAGQSLGGSVAWAAAQRQHKRPVAGYLGTITASPFSDALLDIAEEHPTQVTRIVGIAQGLKSVFPSFELSDWLTPLGISRLRLLQEIYGCSATASRLFSSDDGPQQFIKPEWNTTKAAQWYRNTTLNSGRPFAGPMLVLQGTNDPNAIEAVTTRSVNETCGLFPGNDLEYIRFRNTTHVAPLFAGQHLYLDWIGDRFRGIPVERGCRSRTIQPAKTWDSTTIDAWSGQKWFIEYDAYGLTSG